MLKMSFDKMFDLTAEWSVFFVDIIYVEQRIYPCISPRLDVPHASMPPGVSATRTGTSVPH